MKRALILSLLIASGSCLLTFYVLAQDGTITNSVGTASCESFNDGQGNHCRKIRCPASPDEYGNYDKCDGTPISAALESVQLCELPNVTIDNPISCSISESPPRISYSWTGNDNVQHSETSTIICPHSCTKCAIYPNGYGSCPANHRKNQATGCCVQLSLIASQEICNAVVGYWFNNSCTAPSTPSQCTSVLE